MNRSYVCRVMSGKKKSERVMAALEKEFSRIERKIERETERSVDPAECRTARPTSEEKTKR